MTREELTALRDAIDMTLALPDSIRELLAQWLAPAAAKPNGHGPHRPVPPPTPKAAPTPCSVASKPTTILRTPGPPSGGFSRRCASVRASARLHWRRLSAQAYRPPKRG
jgi:hypothetical protein